MPPPVATAAQRAALDHVRAAARGRLDAARERLAALVAHAGVDADLAAVARTRPVALNFHPDRVAADGRTVVDALLDDGVYRSQWETRISNGGLTAFAGGDRDRWESRLFGGAYQRPGVAAAERPRYGGLDLARHADGPCPRFGSCHLGLRPDSLDRTTVAFGDSVTQPDAVATADTIEVALVPLLEQAASAGVVLGRAVDGAAEAIDFLTGSPPGAAGRSLDDYLEAHVHGEVRLASDVEALVVDPSFLGTPVGDRLERLAARHGLTLSVHPGFVLDAEAIPDDFRGSEAPALAVRVAERYATGGVLHAEVVGRAARAVVAGDAAWAGPAPAAETLQHLKYLWHALVAFGAPAGDGA